MRQVRVWNQSKGRSVGSDVSVAETMVQRMVGLLSTRHLAPGAGLWIRPSSGIHTFGMKYAIDVVGIDKQGHVVRTWPCVYPQRITSIDRRVKSVIELPAGTIAASETAIGDRIVISDKAQDKRLSSDEDGQATVFVALAMVVLLASLAFAIDFGHLHHERRRLQSAADAAALAAALEVRYCGDTANCAAMQSAATESLTENGYSGATLVTNCASSANDFVIELNNPVCAVSTDPNKGRYNFVEVSLHRYVSTYFGRLVGFNRVKLNARAEAARGLGGPCIYALNKSAFGAITMVAGVGVNSQCGVVDESSDPTALLCLVGVAISAPSISVRGGTGGLLCGSSPAPRTNVAVPMPPDPLSYLPAPPMASQACGGSGNTKYVFNGSSSAVSVPGLLDIGRQFTFNPGVYCGGIAITPGVLASVKFNPGMYVLRDSASSGGFNITLGALLSSIDAQGVTFYNQGPTGSIQVAPANTAVTNLLGLSNFNMSAPTSGQYGGVLFYQAHGVTPTGVFLVNLLSGSKMEGAVYLPDAEADYGVAAISNNYNILVADKITFLAAVLSRFGNNYDTLRSGSPLGGDTSVLVQ